MTPPSKKRRCVKCREWFTPHNNNPRQEYCGSPACQRARKALWRRDNYIPHRRLPKEERDAENKRCREAMERLRSSQKLLAAVGVSSGGAITLADVALRSSIFIGVMSMIAGTQDRETVRSVCIEADRRGRLLSRAPANGER